MKTTLSRILKPTRNNPRGDKGEPKDNTFYVKKNIDITPEMLINASDKMECY